MKSFGSPAHKPAHQSQGRQDTPRRPVEVEESPSRAMRLFRWVMAPIKNRLHRDNPIQTGRPHAKEKSKE